MHIIGRVLAIVAAALVVVGLTLVYANASGVSTAGGRGPDAPLAQTSQQPNAAGTQQPVPEGGGNRGGADREGGGFSVFAVGELLKSLGIIAAVVLVTTLAAWVLRRRTGLAT